MRHRLAHMLTNTSQCSNRLHELTQMKELQPSEHSGRKTLGANSGRKHSTLHSNARSISFCLVTKTPNYCPIKCFLLSFPHSESIHWAHLVKKK
jgi:hypothetical protein